MSRPRRKQRKKAGKADRKKHKPKDQHTFQNTPAIPVAPATFGNAGNTTYDVLELDCECLGTYQEWAMEQNG